MIFKKFQIFLEYTFYIIQQVDGKLNIDLDTIERVTMITASTLYGSPGYSRWQLLPLP